MNLGFPFLNFPEIKSESIIMAFSRKKKSFSVVNNQMEQLDLCAIFSSPGSGNVSVWIIFQSKIEMK